MSWTHLDLKSDKLIVVSYHTGGFYERDAFELARSCQQFDVCFHIESLKSMGSWKANVRLKPQFIQRMSEEFDDRPILWLDADARIRRPLDLLGGQTWSVAYHKVGGTKAASGTVYFAPGDRRTKLIQIWVDALAGSPQAVDGDCLDSAFPDAHPLPIECCWIWDFDRDGRRKFPDLTAKPIIEHMQASRWNK